MDELGIDIGRHRSRNFDQLDDDYFDLVVSLSPEAQHKAVELTRNSSCELEFWHMPDPSLAEGTREQRLDAYRELRDLLLRRIRERFPPRARRRSEAGNRERRPLTAAVPIAKNGALIRAALSCSSIENSILAPT